jgi:transcriptional regulator with XRE-family HTH domain
LISQTRHRPPLRDVRTAKGLGLNEVARLADIDPAHLSRVERGEARLSLESLARLAHVLELRELAKLLTPYTRDD